MTAGTGAGGGHTERQGEGSPAAWAELEAQLHELEVLMEELEVPAPLFGAYWDLSAELIALIEEVTTTVASLRSGAAQGRDATAHYRGTRQRVLALQARAQEISLDAGEAGDPNRW